MRRHSSFLFWVAVTLCLVGLFVAALGGAVSAAPQPPDSGDLRWDAPVAEPASPTSTSTPTVTSTFGPPPRVVISEFATRGEYGSPDEFIELFNGSAVPYNVAGWKIRISSSCGTVLSQILELPSILTLQPGQRYLMANSASSVTGPDQTFSSITGDVIADDGGIALVGSNGGIVDQVGMCPSTTYKEGTTLTPLLPGLIIQSYQRLAGGCVDTENNAGDFAYSTSPSPQGRLAAPTPCTGATVPTPSRTPTPTPTVTPTRVRAAIPSPTARPVVVVINEFLPHPHTDWNEDGKANVRDEYIELINISIRPVNLSGWSLDDDVDGSEPFWLSNVTLQPRQVVHFYASETGISLSDGGDTARLIAPAGYTVDAFTYPVVTDLDVTWCRLPDGNGTWKFACRPTPGETNARLEKDGSTSSGSFPRRSGYPSPYCLASGHVDARVVQAECIAAGAGIWNRLFWESQAEAWVWGITKWDIVLK